MHELIYHCHAIMHRAEKMLSLLCVFFSSILLSKHLPVPLFAFFFLLFKSLVKWNFHFRRKATKCKNHKAGSHLEQIYLRLMKNWRILVVIIVYSSSNKLVKCVEFYYWIRVRSRCEYWVKCKYGS